MGYLVKELSISECDIEELKLAILILFEELMVQTILRGATPCYVARLSPEDYAALRDELFALEGLLYIKSTEILIWRGPGDYEWLGKRG